MAAGRRRPPLSRRRFLRRSGAWLAALGAGGCARAVRAPSPAPGRVLGANDTIQIGVIGMGMRGPDLVRAILAERDQRGQSVRLSAVCEIYAPRKERAMRLAGLDRCHHAYEDLLARPDVDAVVLAVPDHWHRRMCLDAIAAGKDVYCEKPLTLYWEEAKEVAQAARDAGRVLQVGATGASNDVWWQARRLIGDGKTGLIGKLLQFQTSYNRNVRGGDWNYTIDPGVTRRNLDWGRFLGPAPRRPFNDEALERYFRFRKFWDYSGGLATDLLYHNLSRFAVALGFPFPKRVSAVGGNYVHFDREVPDTFTILADFEGDFSGMLFATSGNDRDIQDVIRGEHATMTFEREAVIVRPQRPYEDAVAQKAREIEGAEIVEERRDGRTVIREIRLHAAPRPGHVEQFLNALRTRQPTHLGADEGYRVMTTIGLAVAAFRRQSVARFDPARQRLISL